MTPGTGVLAPGGQITADSEVQVMTMRFFGTPSARTSSPPSLNSSLPSAAALVGKGPAIDLLRLHVEDAPLLAAAFLDRRLLAGEEVVERLVRDRDAPRDRRRHEVAFEVVELELRGLADQLPGAVDVRDARELDRDLVVALPRDDRLGDAELVDPVPDDRLGALEVVLGDLPVRAADPPSGRPRDRPGGRGRAPASCRRATAAARSGPRRRGRGRSAKRGRGTTGGCSSRAQVSEDRRVQRLPERAGRRPACRL